jgi:enoyl-CoA hydratase/carnithine racemase
MPSELITERRGAALVLTLSDPPTRNTLSPQIYAAGIEALGIADADPTLRCVILRGDGENFCAGGDLNRLRANRALGGGAQEQAIERFHGLVEALRGLSKPVIAAVEGWAAGGGCSLALACDLIVAADDARFVMSYGRAGLTPDGGATWHLARALPRSVALRLLWLCEPLGAREAQALGLVNWVSTKGGALAEALAVANRLAAMAPNAIAAVKELVTAAGRRDLHEQLDAERLAFVEQLVHDNGGEGLAAFFEKRPPRFR